MGTRRTVLLLVSTALALLLAGGAALAVTKQCVDFCSGTRGGDTLLGDDLGNGMEGLRGNDTLKGFGGEDDLYGGADNDALYGHADGDYMLGGPGDDRLFGGDAPPEYAFADDNLRGGPGNDRLDGGPGSDYYEFFGAFGRDRLSDAGGESDILSFETEDGLVIDLTSGAQPNVKKKTRAGTVEWDDSVTIEVVSGSFGNDTIVGNDAPNRLYGEGGRNNISGGGGGDDIESLGRRGSSTLSGGAGDDTIFGGGVNDEIDCGEGTDSARLPIGAPEPANCETVDRY